MKTLVCGAKTITWGTASCKSPNTDTTMVTTKQFHPKVGSNRLKYVMSEGITCVSAADIDAYCI